MATPIKTSGHSPTGAARPPMTETGRWMALTAALLGWMFDGAEMGLFSQVGRAALRDLLKSNSTSFVESDVGFQFSVIIATFLVGAAAGGVVFGWLGDRIGRVRAMSLSVLVYALFTGLCGLAQSPLQLAILRFIASLGMGGEWSLGVALVMEVWPSRSRAFMAGLIGAAANVGYLLVGLVGIWLTQTIGALMSFLQGIGLPDTWIEVLQRGEGWRVMMMLGTTPALLTFFFRLFVPESDRWHEEKEQGRTGHWATRDLVGVLIGAMGPALIIGIWSVPEAVLKESLGSIEMARVARVGLTLLGLAIATAGYLYPVIRYLQRLHLAGAPHSGATASRAAWQPVVRRMLLGACISGVALLGTWGSTQWAPAWASQLVEGPNAKAVEAGLEKPFKNAKEFTQMASAVGAILGTILAALAGDMIGRRPAYFMLCVLSFGSVVLLFQGNTEYGNFFLVSTFLAGACTASFYGWLPLYLPELFSTNVRATGQGFSFNFGRILAAIGSLQTGVLTAVPSTTLMGHTFAGGYPLACTVISLIYFVGMAIIWTVPETHGKPLPD